MARFLRFDSNFIFESRYNEFRIIKKGFDFRFSKSDILNRLEKN